MSKHSKIAVISRTFSNTPELVEELKRHFTDIRFNPERKLAGGELAAFIGDAEGALIALEQFDEDVLGGCPNLKIVSKYGVGLDNVDQEACKKNGVKVGWTGGTNRLSVAEMTLGFMLALSRNLFKRSIELKRGVWDKNGGADLSGRTVGIIGVGHVGKEVIRLLGPFNCKILVNDIIDQSEYYKAAGVTEAGKEEIFARADIVSLHVPLTPDTKHMINKNTLAAMRSDAYVINTARGPLVDYRALKEALRSNQVAGAAIDVYDDEPPTDKELLAFDSLICTPHIGGNSKESVLNMGMAAIEHLKQHFLP